MISRQIYKMSTTAQLQNTSLTTSKMKDLSQIHLDIQAHGVKSVVSVRGDGLEFESTASEPDKKLAQAIFDVFDPIINAQLSAAKKNIAETDIPMITVIEDIIDILLTKKVLKKDDFPVYVLQKIIDRKVLRQEIKSLEERKEQLIRDAL